jgi:hypothetical protein
LNSNLRHFSSFTFILVSCGESHCLSRSVQVAGAAWRVATRIMTREGDQVQRTGDGRTGQILGGQVIERLGGALCGLHRARGNEKHRFLG